MFLNGGGRGVGQMVMEVEEQAVGTVLGLLLCYTFDVGTGIRNCFLEYRKYVLIVVPLTQVLNVFQSCSSAVGSGWHSQIPRTSSIKWR